MSDDQQRADERIRGAEERLDKLRSAGVETKSLRSCLGLARSWLKDGSPAHAEAIVDEVMSVAGRLDSAPTGAADEPSPVGSRLLDLEHRLRDHFSRELGQALAAKPWNLERKTEERGHGSGVRDQLDILRAQLEELRKLMQEGGGAGVSLDEVKSVIAGELEANGLESRARRALAPGESAPVPPFVERMDARLMQVANAQNRVADRLGLLEHEIHAAMAQLGAAGSTLSPEAANAPTTSMRGREATGSWLQELEASMPVGDGPAHAGPTVATPMPSTAPGVADSAVEPTEAPTIAFAAGPANAAPVTGPLVRDTPAPGTGPLARDPSAPVTGALARGPQAPAAIPVAQDASPASDSHLKALIAAEVSRQAQAVAPAAPAATTVDDAELVRRMVRLLPEVLRVPEVREAVLAVVAVEAAANPGALAELSGVRAFLRRELLRQVDELKKALAIGEPV